MHHAGSTVTLASSEPRHALTERINELPLSELGVMTMTVRPTTLNDVFLHLTDASSEPGLLAAEIERR